MTGTSNLYPCVGCMHRHVAFGLVYCGLGKWSGIANEVACNEKTEKPPRPAPKSSAITLDQLRAIMPLAGARAGIFLAPLNSAMEEFSIDNPLRQAAFLAQVAHESGSLRYVRELASGAAYDDRDDLGNTRAEAVQIASEHDSTPGRWWRGHGLIQITGFDNHRACSIALYNDPNYLLHHPEALELPAPAARSAAWFWLAHHLNERADERAFQLITRIINGGYNGFQDRLAFYERAQKVLA
jgi:putative chitinase